MAPAHTMPLRRAARPRAPLLVLAAAALLLAPAAATGVDPVARGTALWLYGAAPAVHPMRITDTGDEGASAFAELAAGIGFALEEALDADVALTLPYLEQYAVVFFASNNRLFSAAEAAAVADYVAGGGGVVGFSDCGFGPSYDGANTAGADSDNSVFAQFGMTFLRDNLDGRYKNRDYTRDHFLNVVDVRNFLYDTGVYDDSDPRSRRHSYYDEYLVVAGDDVSMIRASAGAEILAYPQADDDRTAVLHPFDGPLTNDIGTLVINEFGAGRVVGFMDRDTFQNDGYVDIDGHDNEVFLERVLLWASSQSDPTVPTPTANPVTAPPSVPAQPSRLLYVYGAVPPNIHDMQTTDPLKDGTSSFAAEVRQLGLEVDQALDISILLTTEYLAPYSVLVLASNSRIFAPSEAAALDAWVRAGGGLIVFSDGKFGPRRTGANSDNSLVSQFGITFLRDNGQGPHTIADDEIVEPHYILWVDPEDPSQGLLCFQGTGINPFRIDPASPMRILAVPVDGTELHEDDGDLTDDVGALAIGSFGAGRVVATFDRNSFANDGEVSIQSVDNREYNNRLVLWAAQLENGGNANPTASASPELVCDLPVGDAMAEGAVYKLGDHPSGVLGLPGYGLRIRSLSCTFGLPTSDMRMYYAPESSLLRIYGVATCGIDEGDIHVDPMPYEIDFTYTTGFEPLPLASSVVITDAEGAVSTINCGTMTSASESFGMCSKADADGDVFLIDTNHRGAPGFSGWGWVRRDDDPRPTQDFLFTIVNRCRAPGDETPVATASQSAVPETASMTAKRSESQVPDTSSQSPQPQTQTQTRAPDTQSRTPGITGSNTAAPPTQPPTESQTPFTRSTSPVPASCYLGVCAADRFPRMLFEPAMGSSVYMNPITADPQILFSETSVDVVVYYSCVNTITWRVSIPASVTSELTVLVSSVENLILETDFSLVNGDSGSFQVRGTISDYELVFLGPGVYEVDFVATSFTGVTAIEHSVTDQADQGTVLLFPGTSLQSVNIGFERFSSQIACISCPTGEEPDVCGVCGGDGSSCISTDQTRSGSGGGDDPLVPVLAAAGALGFVTLAVLGGRRLQTRRANRTSVGGPDAGAAAAGAGAGAGFVASAAARLSGPGRARSSTPYQQLA